MEGICGEDNNLDSLFFDEWNDIGSDNINNGARNSTWQNVSNTSSLFNNTTSVNNSTNRLDVSALCCDEELSGFDKNAGPTWIYPTNYPIRDYQFNIVSNALFKNTLVSLPTGLGKTFIAAVLMYNYYRWYPLGKIVFTAPTRPLVAQQIEACYNITAIPQQDTVEMTGSMQVNARKIAWKQKRVFFATPQVVNNDLESGICPGELVRCLVIDEAHRAKGRHAYCQLVEGLTLKGHTLLRILALSATPGSKVEDVITVVKNLHISHLELRSEQCIDVAMYSHSRKIDTIVVPLGDELTNVRKQFVEIMDIYTRRLVQYKILNGNVSSLSKGRIIMLFKEYQNKEKTQRHPQHQRIMQDFTMVITLYHALELLTKHGARVFLNFFDERTDKHWVGKDDNLTCFLERLRDDLGVNPFTINRSTLPDGTIPEIRDDLKFGHPKFDFLKDVIMKHFDQAEKKGSKTKAIVFCEYRESVNLVHCLLLQCRPKIRPHVFIGQGAGSAGNANKDSNLKAFSQKQQLKVMKMFREDVCNVLVSTCIGEEGLDVGSVDLIICFDISNKSPIRLVQRCGRTGREREGRVVILVTEGREHQTLRECIVQRDSLNRRVLQSKELVKNLYSASSRMIPRNLNPKCQKMFITVQKPTQEEKPKKSSKVQSKIKDIFKKNTIVGSIDSGCDPGGNRKNVPLTNEDFTEMYPNGMPSCSRLQGGVEYWNKTKDFFQADVPAEELDKKIKLSEWLEWQRTLQFTVNVDHSVDTEILSHILKTADSKRFENPVATQILDSPPPEAFVSKPKTPNKKNPSKTKSKIVKNDIRTMFKKMHKPTEEEIEKEIFDTKAKEIFEDCGIHTDNVIERNNVLEADGITSSMIDLMVEINLELPKMEVKKNFQYDPHSCFRTKSIQRNIPACLSPYFKLPDESIILNSLKNIQHIDIEDFERILKLEDNQQKCDESKNFFDAQSSKHKKIDEIDFCDDSLLRLNDREVVFDHSLPNNVNKSMNIVNNRLNNENLVDQDICKAMMNDDFELGDIDDIFEDTDDGYGDNQKDLKTNNVPNVNQENCDSSAIINEKDNKTELISNDNCDNELVINQDNEDTEECQFNDKIVFENDFDFGDIDDIFENTDDDFPTNNNEKRVSVTKPENNKSVISIDETIKENKTTEVPPANPLTFFGLEDVEDLFENDDFENCDKKVNEKQIEKQDKSTEPPDSPILYSQRTSLSKIKKLSLNSHVTSTPHPSSPFKSKTNVEYSNTQFDKSLKMLHRDVSILSNSFFNSTAKQKVQNSFISATNKNVTNTTLNKTDATSFTITQIIDLVNKEVDQSKTLDNCKKNLFTNKTADSNKKVDCKGDKNSSDESNHSFILCSQVSKPLKKKTDYSSQKVSVTILETSESSDDDIAIIETNENVTKETREATLEKKNYFQSNGVISAKRKLISSDDEFESSPFFKQQTDMVSSLSKRNKMSLRDKIASTMAGVRKIEQSQSLLASQARNCSQGSSKNMKNKENTQFTKQIKSPITSQLSQFSRSKPTQWTSNSRQVQKHNLNSSISKPTVISSDDEGDDDFKEKTPRRNRRITKRKETKKKRCQFIDYEAALSDDSYEDSGDDEHSQNRSGDTSILKFICDEEVEDHHQNNGVDMEAKYLQSVRSPVKSHGQFKIPTMMPKKPDISIFSQVDPDDHIDYELDSFCVEDHILSQRHEMTELEIAEAILKKRKRRRKKESNKFISPVKVNVPCTTNPADDSPIAVNKKKRIYQQIQSESSTDDELFL